MSKRQVATFELTGTMHRGIGRLIVEFAYVESYLQGIVYDLVGVDRATGKLAVREPRPSDKINLILDLIAVRGITQPAIDFKALTEAIEDLEDIRNNCAHGVWIWSPEHQAWAVIVEKGNWAGTPKGDRLNRKKQIRPDGQIISPQVLKSYLRGLEGVRAMLRELQKSVEQQLRQQARKA